MCVLIALSGCTMEKPVFTDFIGTWTSEDGSKIILKKDSTCIVEQIDIGRLHDYTENIKSSFAGKWSLEDEDNLGNKEYNIVIRQDSMYLYESFIVSGQGVLKNNQPWCFFQYIGDPDDLNEYKFIKAIYGNN